MIGSKKPARLDTWREWNHTAGLYRWAEDDLGRLAAAQASGQHGGLFVTSGYIAPRFDPTRARRVSIQLDPDRIFAYHVGGRSRLPRIHSNRATPAVIWTCTVPRSSWAGGSR